MVWVSVFEIDIRLQLLRGTLKPPASLQSGFNKKSLTFLLKIKHFLQMSLRRGARRLALEMSVECLIRSAYEPWDTGSRDG